MTAIAEPTRYEAKAPAIPDFYDLLEQAVNEPGELSAAHKYFRQYSLTNRWLASTQLRKAGLPLTPINTFKGWLNANRPVQKGQKASVALIMPVPVKGKKKDDASGEEDKVLFTKFMLRSYWFHMGQTDGEEFTLEQKETADWNLKAAMDFLEITETAFEFTSVTDTRRQGTAVQREISISPLQTNHELARLREMARIMLGHTAVTPAKNVPMETDVRDIEAETVAYLVAATLGLPGLEESRALIQRNLDGGSKTRIPDKSAHRSFSAADKLINAGYC